MTPSVQIIHEFVKIFYYVEEINRHACTTRREYQAQCKTVYRVSSIASALLTKVEECGNIVESSYMWSWKMIDWKTYKERGIQENVEASIKEIYVSPMYGGCLAKRFLF